MSKIYIIPASSIRCVQARRTRTQYSHDGSSVSSSDGWGSWSTVNYSFTPYRCGETIYNSSWEVTGSTAQGANYKRTQSHRAHRLALLFDLSQVDGKTIEKIEFKFNRSGGSGTTTALLYEKTDSTEASIEHLTDLLWEVDISADGEFAVDLTEKGLPDFGYVLEPDVSITSRYFDVTDASLVVTTKESSIYVQTENGLVQGAVYVQTENGLVLGTVYVQTENGLKQSG